jgi:hypothetical protein
MAPASRRFDASDRRSSATKASCVALHPYKVALPQVALSGYAKALARVHRPSEGRGGETMRPTLIGLAAASCVILGLAGCSPAASTDTSAATAPPTGAPSTLATAPTTAAPVPAAPNQLVCTAMQLAARGAWSQAETHWLSAEEHAATSNPDATQAFYLLVTDSGAVATDQLTGAPQAADIATYNTDLAGDTAFTAGC